MALDHFSKLRSVDMGIDLGRADIRVAQEVLNDPKVGAAHEKMSRETVAKFVGMNVSKAGNCRVLADDLPHRDPLKGAAAEGEHQVAAVSTVIKSKEIRAGLFKIFQGPFHRGVPDRYDALFGSFPRDGKARHLLVEFVDPKRCHLAGPKARRVHQLKHGAIAYPESAVIRLRGFDEFPHFHGAHHAGHSLPLCGSLEQSGRVSPDLPI